MTEEERKTNENEASETGNDYQEYIDTINDLKANTVPKAKYDQAMEEKKQLIEALKTGGQVNVQGEEEKIDVDQIRQDMFGTNKKDMTNLEYITNALKLRKALLERGERDPFLPNDADYVETQDDIDKANYYAEVYQECIDYANGNAQLFTQELQRRTKDDSLINGRKF